MIPNFFFSDSIIFVWYIFLIFSAIDAFLKQNFIICSSNNITEIIGSLTDGTSKINLRIRGQSELGKFANFAKGDAVRVTGHVDIDGEFVTKPLIILISWIVYFFRENRIGWTDIKFKWHHWKTSQHSKDVQKKMLWGVGFHFFQKV